MGADVSVLNVLCLLRGRSEHVSPLTNRLKWLSGQYKQQFPDFWARPRNLRLTAKALQPNSRDRSSARKVSSARLKARNCFLRLSVSATCLVRARRPHADAGRALASLLLAVRRPPD